MSLLDKFRATLTRSPRKTTASEPAPPPKERKQPKPREDPSVSLSITSDGVLTVSTTGDDRFDFPVTPEEIEAWTSQYDYVLAAELPALERKHRWWDEKIHKKQLQAGSEESSAWLVPFIPNETILLEEIRPVREGGVGDIQFATKNLRITIRERCRQKQRYDEELKALYGLAILQDFIKGLVFAGYHAYSLGKHVDIRDLARVTTDFNVIGYECLDSLSKTDVKWLVASHGEPQGHHSVHSLYPAIRKDAISRFCWAEIRKRNQSSKHFGGPVESLEDWFKMTAGIQIRIEKYQQEWMRAAAERKQRAASNQ